jgi:hypothetical protein
MAVFWWAKFKLPYAFYFNHLGFNSLIMVTEACTICHAAPSQCDCVTGLANFMNILLRTEARVSSTQVASKHVGPDRARACLDKLIFISETPIPRSVIEQRLKALNINFRISTLADKKWYLSTKNGLQLFLGHPNNVKFHKIITRPSAYRDWNQYIRLLEDLFGEWIDNFRIYRIDLAVDYMTPFSNLLKCLDIAHKRQRTEFQEKSGLKTGLIVGVGSNKLVIYDKANESGLNESMSRIELQLTGKSVPTTTIHQLQETLCSADFRPFGIVRLHDVEVHSHPSTHPNPVVERINEFKTLVQHNGFYGARKSLNQARNFDRDYAKHLTLSHWSLDPNEVLHESLMEFFK